jgi:hypothetical protein
MMKKIGTEFILEGGEVYQDYLDERRKLTEALVDKWQWLLEGTSKQQLKPIDQKQWPVLAMLFENQVMHAARGRQLVMEQTMTTDVAMPVTYSLPIIRNVFPNLIAMKVASVQPLPMSSGGVGNVFYQDFLREDAGNTNLTTADSDYAQGAENSIPKRIKMTITKQTVTTDKKILAATWSQEVEEDARGALNIDVESELITQASLEIQREIDQIVLAEMLLWAGAGNVNWNWTVPAGTLPKDHYQGLGEAVIDAEDLIYGARYKEAQWIICGRHVATFMRKMLDFKPEPRANDPFKLGVELIGRIEGLWDVYRTPYINTNRAIMGIYPTSVTDTGYVFAPYIPIEAMQKVYAEFKPYNDATMPGAYINADKWTRNIRTRYAKKLVVPNLFSTLAIAA